MNGLRIGRTIELWKTLLKVWKTMRYFIVETIYYKTKFLVHAHSENAARHKARDEIRNIYGVSLHINEFEVTELNEIFRNKDVICL